MENKKLSEKYFGCISKGEGRKLDKHIKKCRDEWEDCTKRNIPQDK